VILNDAEENKKNSKSNRIQPNLKSIVPLLNMMGSDFFFAIMAVLRIQYTGVENSYLLQVYAISIGLMIIALFIKDVINESRLSFSDLLVLLLPLFYYISYFASGVFGDTSNALATRIIVQFSIWIVPAICAAIYAAKLRSLGQLMSWMELVMIILTIGVFADIVVPMIQGRMFVSFSGADYQRASYFSAFALGLNLYFSFFAKSERFVFFKSPYWKAICFVLFFLQVVGVVIPGGRGGAVLGVLYIALTLFLLSRRKRRTRLMLIRNLSYLALLIIVFLLVMPVLMENEVFLKGFIRATQFISESGRINWAGTSYRDILYGNAVDLIEARPFLGYGIFGYIEKNSNIYPHNLLLEILLQGGVVYFLVAISLLSVLIVKSVYLVKYRQEFIGVIYLLVYPFTLLMFSGSYLQSSQFWFIIVLISLMNSRRSSPKV